MAGDGDALDPSLDSVALTSLLDRPNELDRRDFADALVNGIWQRPVHRQRLLGACWVESERAGLVKSREEVAV